MPKYRVTGANRETGHEISQVVTADTPEDAEAVAIGRGWLVSDIQPFDIDDVESLTDSLEEPTLLTTHHSSRRKRKAQHKSAKRTRPCKYCDSEVARNTKRCPSCGGKKPFPLNAGEYFIGIAAVLVIIIFSCVGLMPWPGDGNSTDVSRERHIEGRHMQYESAIRGLLSGMEDVVDEVSWIAFDGRDVIVGFTSRPSDFDTILHAWAFQASDAINGDRVTMWGVPARFGPNWRPADNPNDRIYGYYSFSTRHDW